MRWQGRVVWSVLSPVVLLAVSAAPVGGQTPQHELLKKCSIVFVGQVVRVGDVSFAGVPKSSRTIVVQVDEVFEKPRAVSLVKGDRVTVEVKDPAKFREGARVTFYANGWIFGDGVAVREVGHEIIPVAVKTGSDDGAGQQVTRIRKELSDAEVQSRIQAADMVAVGRVKAIRPATRAVAGDAPKALVSEHNADWQEAVIEVESGIKGAQANQEIVVRFPGSLDAAWYGVPKFKLGQEGTFFLQKDTLSGTPKALLGGAIVDAYIARSPRDVLAKSEAQRVRGLARP